jgi:hypothetical protein
LLCIGCKTSANGSYKPVLMPQFLLVDRDELPRRAHRACFAAFVHAQAIGPCSHCQHRRGCRQVRAALSHRMQNATACWVLPPKPSRVEPRCPCRISPQASQHHDKETAGTFLTELKCRGCRWEARRTLAPPAREHKRKCAADVSQDPLGNPKRKV